MFSLKMKHAEPKPNEAQEIETLFKKVFLSPDGEKVLHILFRDWCMFDVCNNDEQRALNEYGKVFLKYRLGMSCIGINALFDETELINKKKQESEDERIGRCL